MIHFFSFRTLIAILLSLGTISAAASDIAQRSDEQKLQQAEKLAANNKSNEALALLFSLNKKEKLSIDKNLLLLTLGRVFYQKNDLSGAIGYYDQVSKGSDFWIEAQEEKAWAYTRNKNYDSALAPLKSLFSSIFSPQIGPETYVLSAFVDYKVCDYKRAYDKILDFKSKMLPRAKSLESISKEPNNEVVKKWLKKMELSSVTSADIGNDLSLLPSFFYRDEILIRDMQAKKINSALLRIQQLAKSDLAEIEKNLNKMKILEVEVIQRSFAYQKNDSNDDLSFGDAQTDANAEKLNTKKSDIITFPVEKNSKEVWIDEIGRYQVRTQRCPTNPGGRS